MRRNVLAFPHISNIWTWTKTYNFIISPIYSDSRRHNDLRFLPLLPRHPPRQRSDDDDRSLPLPRGQCTRWHGDGESQMIETTSFTILVSASAQTNDAATSKCLQTRHGLHLPLLPPQVEIHRPLLAHTFCSEYSGWAWPAELARSRFGSRYTNQITAIAHIFSGPI